MNKKYKCQILMSGLMLAVACNSFAHTGNTVELQAIQVLETQTQNAEDTATTILSDRLHQISRSLDSATTVHSYSFTSVRGQNVMLAASNREHLNRTWKLEYRTKDGEWRVKNSGSPELFSSLRPGTKMELRVSAIQRGSFQRQEYGLVFGSAPHMLYDLQHEEGFLTMPFKLTSPVFLGTQAMTNTLLDVTFTDSKGYPLEGGVVDFELELTEPKRYVRKTLLSNSSGKAQELLQIGSCQGGTYAGNFIERRDGVNTWGTRYKGGTYFARNTLLEHLANKPHVYNFGHICKRTLVNWSRK